MQQHNQISNSQKCVYVSGTGKHNGAPSSGANVRNRPRIPTPDVTKEVVDREHRLAGVGNINQINPVTLIGHQLNSGYAGYTGSDMPVVQVVLSPIQELDGSGSHNNTLHAGQPGTAALAQAVLSPALTSAGIGPVLATGPVSLTPVTVSQLSSLGLAVTTTSNSNSPLLARSDLTLQQAPPTNNIQTLTLTELTEDDSNRSSAGSSIQGAEEKVASRKTSVTSQTTAPAGSPKRGEVYV